MSVRALGYAVGQIANRAANAKARWAAKRAQERVDSNRFSRAVNRVALSATCVGPLGFCLYLLWQFQDVRHPDKPWWIAVACGAVAVFLPMLRRFGGGRGVVRGFWLWMLSFGWVGGRAAGVVALFATFKLLVNLDGGHKVTAIEVGGLLALWVITIMLGSCDELLRHAEADER